MKKLLLSLSILLFGGLLVAVPARVHAVDVLNDVCNNPSATEKPTVCKDNHAGGENPIFGPHSVLAKVINILSWVVGIISVFVIIINALKLMTSMGDPSGVATARGGIIYAAIAIVITMAAQVVVRLLLSKL